MSSEATPTLSLVPISNPNGLNFILGQSVSTLIAISPEHLINSHQKHFIKTVEDVAEVLAQSSPHAKWGVAFCEASGPRLIRYDGNATDLEQLAVTNAEKIAAGHTFIVFVDGIYPVAVLPAIKALPETCRIFCATANPTLVVVASSTSAEGVQRGVLGVLDGFPPLGVEAEEDRSSRIGFLRTVGYKRG
ncbi:DUF355-domain-containing protein [Gonapodya prolifera JEL478]|uniref:DUF355-domain-containing protein n=1 Tax=Gonapodya prolifera (strain JEL478) TaxID=1344416 RepID=A0A139AUG4_GONPJ|nr:DUF355-domain-containing protein [Gonapodya prolifera JEL478]|eukprot:KXS20371.1 DUF355-domain-containing protein [Gonapodya prolifera JEL478]